MGLLCYGSSRVVDWGFSGEILVGSFDTDAVPPLVASSLPGGRRGYPLSASICVPGETLGPMVRAAAHALLLEGVDWHLTVQR